MASPGRPPRREEPRTDRKNSGYAVAVMPNAKGKFSEQHASFIGTYWGHVSSPFCCEVVESADVVLALGPMMNDCAWGGKGKEGGCAAWEGCRGD